MLLNIDFSKDLTLDIRKCPHLLIIGKGDQYSEFADNIQERYNHVKDLKQELCCYNWWDNTDEDNNDFNEMLEERYNLLSMTDLTNIEQYNQKFKFDYWFYHILLASPSILKHNASKQVLMKGRAVGMHMIMFADSVAEFGDDADLLDMFPVKLVYKVNNAEESILLTGCAGAENLKDNEFMLCELGKQPVVYKS